MTLAMTNKVFMMPSPQEMGQLVEFCKVMASSPFYQKLGPGGVMAIYLTAKEYGLPFMACLNGGLHTFDGKVTFSAIMIDALILNAGHKTEVLHLDELRCKIRFTRGDRKNDKGYKPFEFEYTIHQAQKAGYMSKNNWKTSPKDMLYSRCITGGGRKHIPEIFVGVLVAGEMVGNDSDGDVPPSGAPEPIETHTEDLPLSTELVQPKAIEYVQEAGFQEFVAKHKLYVALDEKEPVGKYRYLLETCKKANMSEVQVINSAIKNEKIFEERYQKWCQGKNPKQEDSAPAQEMKIAV